MCLFISDLQKIEIGPNDDYSFNGKTFSSVMVHGRSMPLNVRHYNNGRMYNIDDGTESVIVHYSHGSKTNSDNMKELERLKNMVETCKRGGIQDHLPGSEKCIQLVKDMTTILNLIEKRVKNVSEYFKLGKKLFVIGRPFRQNDRIHISSWYIQEDGGSSCIPEIHWKKMLIREKYQHNFSK